MGGQIIEYRSVEIRSDTERRVFNWTEDNTCLHVKACTIYLHLLLAVGDCSILQILRIERDAVVVNIMQADGQTKPHTIVKATAYIEIVLTNITMLILTVKEKV